MTDFLAAFNNLDWSKFRSCWVEQPDSASFETAWRRQFESTRQSAAQRGVTAPPFQNLQPQDLRIDFPGADTAVVTGHLTGNPERVGRWMFVLAGTAAGWKFTHLHASNMPLTESK